MRTALIAIILLTWLTGCVLPSGVVRDDPAYAPKYPTVVTPAPATAGSLYSDSGFNGLFRDAVAHRVGDIITVQLNERTTSRKSASTSVSKSNESNMTEPTILGKRLSVPPLNNLTLTDLNNETEFSGSSDSD